MYILPEMFYIFNIKNKAPHFLSKSFFSNLYLQKTIKDTIKVIGNINPEVNRLNIPKINPKNSPLVVNSAVFILRYPKIMKSKNPSTDIDRIGLKDKF